VARDGRGIRSRASKVQQPSVRKKSPDDLGYFTSVRQPTAGAHDRRYDRAVSMSTRGGCVRHVRAFAALVGRSPDTATAEDPRFFQRHRTQIGTQPPSINSAVSALRFLFTVTLGRPDLTRRLTVVPQPRRISSVLSVEEVTLLLRAISAPKYMAAFATAGACPRAGQRADLGGAGLRVSEVIARKVGDIDSERMLLRVERGRGRKSLPSQKRGIVTRSSRRALSRAVARMVAHRAPEGMDVSRPAPAVSRLPWAA
jgi:site-specific recombinase XerC